MPSRSWSSKLLLANELPCHRILVSVVQGGMNMSLARAGEHTHAWERKERFYSIHGHFYFKTREGVEVGPFASKNMAKRGLELYKYVVNECSTSGLYASRIVTEL